MDLFKLLDVSSPKIIRDTLNRTVTAFNILEEYVTHTADTAAEHANVALTNSTQASSIANTAHKKAEEAVATANEAKTESTSAKDTANTAEANSINAINTATTAANASAVAEQNALAALETAQEALDHVTDGSGTRVSVNGEVVRTFNADTKADLSYVDAQVAALIGAAPETLNTLEEVAKAIEENEGGLEALNALIANTTSTIIRRWE
jgi:hypothetical protein